MGYSVQYPTGKENKYPQVPRRESKGYVVIGCIVVMLLVVAVVCCLPSSRSAVLPGDPEVTEKALRVMIDRLEEGQGIKACFTEFCREVISAGSAGLS